ncbi:carboxypeptidase family protein [Sphingobacterium yanglingense]|uniref:Carboxypeptidase family protein n=2 Tax=Sphingobacterium yanglingense TaxID=1437280 RepID=A0A4R6WMV7_9SPHI|nr:carboxypeptidase family protein [Sphingobacterium yanglingense]
MRLFDNTLVSFVVDLTILKINMKKSLLFFALVLASYGTVQAQVTTSSMNGVVTESSGHVTVGATIKAIHLPSGTAYSGSANSTGRFNLANMRVGGPYRVEVTYVGQNPIVYEDVYLQLGQAFVLNPIFGDTAKALDEVTVTGRRGASVLKSGASTRVGQRQIQVLPQTSRSITEFTRLTPQANGTSFAGRDARYNNLQIDGANFNNGFGTDTNNPLPGGRSQPISLDAIEEISVNIAPFDITQSGFTGAGINAVTKSGTNTFHGTAYGYFTNENLNGYKINGEKGPDFVLGAKKNFGVTVGGPIIKDKLFFFLSAEREAATGANASGANLWKASKDGTANIAQNISRVKEDDLIAVQNHLKTVWGYDPGAYQGFANTAEQYGNKFLARIDYNINDKHKLAFRYNVLRGESNQITNNDSGPRPRSTSYRISENSMAFQNAHYSFENIVRSFTTELNSSFNSIFSNKFLFTYSKIQERRKTPSDQLFPFVDIWDGNVGSNPAVGTANYMSFGTELFSYKNDVVNDNYSFTNNLNMNFGKHNITAGAAFEIQKFGNSYTRMGTGYYRYASVADFLKTGTPQEVAPIMYGITYPYEGQDTYSRINFGLASLYAQDRFSVNDQLDLTFGLRAELPIYINKLAGNKSIDALELLDINGNPRHYSSSTWPKSRVMLSPRLGFNYDVFGDRSLTLRGGTGIFTGRIPFVWLTNMPTASGVLQNTIEPDGYNAVKDWIGGIRFQPNDPYYYVNNVPAGGENVFIKTPNEGAPATFALVDDNFRMPMVWRSSLGVDYQIPNTPVTLITDLLYTKDVYAVMQFGANRKSSKNFLNNAGDNRELYTNLSDYRYNDKIGANSATVLTNTSVKGYALSATFGASVSRWNGLSGSVFYTYSKAKDVSANSGSSAASAWGASPVINSPNDMMLHTSNFAIPHRVVANISYTIKNTTLGIYYDGSHQGRYSYYYQNDLNGDGLAVDLMYLPNKASDLRFEEYSVNYKNSAGQTVSKKFTVDDQEKALEAFIAENNLESYRGKYLPRNEFLMPWLNRFDVRWTQDLFSNIGMKGDKLQMTVDIVNFANLLNSNWGVQTNILSAGRNILTTRSIDNQNVPTFRMMNNTDANIDNGAPYLVNTPFRPASTKGTTWTATLGLRYAF